MSGADARSDQHWSIQPSAYWLPPYDTGNGLAAAAWAPIADLPPAEALLALADCASAGIAAFTAPRDGGRPRPGPVAFRVWVDSQRFGAAEDALRHTLNRRVDRDAS